MNVRPALVALFLLASPVGEAMPAAGATITNQATMTFLDTNIGGDTSLQSNATAVQVTEATQSNIEFYTDSAYRSIDNVAHAGDPLYLFGTAIRCNDNVAALDRATLTLTSLETGDTEIYSSQESGRSTGDFWVEGSMSLSRNPEAEQVPNGIQTEDVRTHPVVKGDGILQVAPDDEVKATLAACEDGEEIAWILFDPEGVVFDSRTNQPIPNAIVDIIDVTGNGNGGNPGGPAVVFGYDGTTPLEPTYTTDETGHYSFPLVPPSTYRIVVRPPGNYKFASVLKNVTFEDREIDPEGSFGGTFIVDEDSGDVTLDIPLDAPTDGWLFARKLASRQVAEIGEFVDYTVLVRNQSPGTLAGIQVTDTLPGGFSYERNTVRLNGKVIAEPAGGKGPHLLFALEPLESGSTATLTYRVRIGPGAMLGDGLNRAQASIPSLLVSSNVAEARVRVEGGVFSTDAFILGKFYADCNGDGLQDAGEPGVPQARIYLEDGSFVITDGEGKYSFAGITPRTHVLKVDATTLPSGTQLASISNRSAGDPATLFVDLKNGELHRADFALSGCPDSTLASLEERRRRTDSALEVEQGVRTALTADGKPLPLGDARSLPASGLLGANTQNVPAEGQTQTLLVDTAPPAGPPPPVVAPAATPPVAEPSAPPVAVASSDAHFITFKDGDVMRSAQSSVRVQGRADSELTLIVNGEAVPESRIGTRGVDKGNGTETREYIGVDLQPGENTLTLTQLNEDGTHAENTIKVIAPGELARIQIELVTPAEADGNKIARLKLRLLDEHNVLITERTPVDLQASIGDLLMQDLNETDPGVQLFVEGGEAEIALRAPLEPAESTVRARSGSVMGEVRVPFLAELRPMLAAGVIEGVLNLRKLDSRALVPARQQDHFEDEIRDFARSSNDGKRAGGARASMFLKGKVKGEYLLTLGYDSDKDTRERLFRDIQPDQFYPVYGDSAIKGFEAQSTGRLYVRVDKQRSYLLYGDFTTQGPSTARSLSAYNRSQNGLKEHYQTDRLAVNAFASRDSTTQLIDEIPGNGTSGPYQLRVRNAEINSERVEILTRDRNQPAIVLQTSTQNRFSDYEIEPFTGRILFRRPIPSVDEDLNPISIRVTYEVDTGGEAFWLAGTDAQFKLTDTIEIGGMYADDRNPLDSGKLAGVNVQFKLAEATTLTAEAARSDRDTTGAGDGERVELRHEDGPFQLRAYAGRTDSSFNNPSAFLNGGRSEGGLKSAWRLSEQTKLVGEAIHTADVATDSNRNGVLLGVERRLPHDMRLDLGGRYVRDERDPSILLPTAEPITETTSVRAKLSAQVPKHPEASVYVEGEQAIDESDKHLAAIGGDYQVANRGRIYARHEFISSLSGPYALNDTQRQNTTVVGLDTDYMRDGHTFNEYRVRDGLSGREAEAAFGVRNRWKIAEGLRADTGFERVHAFSDVDQNESTAITSALEYTRNPLWKGTARLEYRTSPSSDSILNTLGIARKLSDDWTLLAKSILFLTDNKGPDAEDRNLSRFQIGAAYRDNETNVWSGLARYEFRREDDNADVLNRVDHSAHIVSSHVNMQASQSVVYTARYAAKAVRDQSNGIVSHSFTNLVSGRVTWDVTSKWDVGAIATTLFTGGATSRQYGLGAEAGRVIKDNLWLSVGYNVFGFKDDDLAGEEYTNKGVFVRLRFKFDESLFSRVGRQ